MVKDHFKQIYKIELKELANKYNISVQEVADIYFNQFKLIINQIRSDSKLPINQRSSIKIGGLGTIHFHPKIAIKILKLKPDEYPKPDEFPRIEKNS